MCAVCVLHNAIMMLVSFKQTLSDDLTTNIYMFFGVVFI